MPRAPRLVVPGLPHHVTQRGNRQQVIFFSDEDRAAYQDILAIACTKHGTKCLAWCLMDNHVHLVLVPSTPDGLRATLVSAHTTYAQRINRMQGQTGHLFQGRFHSYAMDEGHALIAIRYVENNPVKARIVKRAEEWRWSSARAHIHGLEDGLTDLAAYAGHIPNWSAMLARGLEAGDEPVEIVEIALRSGRPLGPVAGYSPTPPKPRGRPRRDNN